MKFIPLPDLAFFKNSTLHYCNLPIQMYFATDAVYFWSVINYLDIENKNHEEKKLCVFHCISLTIAGKRSQRQSCIPIKLRVPPKVPPTRLSQILERLEMWVQQFNTLVFTAVWYCPTNMNVFSWLFLLQGKVKTFAYTFRVSPSSRTKKALQQEHSNSHAIQKNYKIMNKSI